jgi:CheY-like chemotaxis protein
MLPAAVVVMPNVLVVEDDLTDLGTASNLLTELGVEKIESATTVGAALNYLEDVAERKRSAPALIVLDLSFGYESGFEVLRRWKSDAQLKAIKIVVWTQMGEREQELCKLFGLEYVVSKWDSIMELRTAFEAVLGQPESRARKTS